MNKVRMKIEMDVTIPQGLTLKAMFEHWGYLSAIGSSDVVGFFVDGDGNFHPNMNISFDGDIPELTDELRALACDDKQAVFDFDNIAWKLREENNVL